MEKVCGQYQCYNSREDLHKAVSEQFKQAKLNHARKYGVYHVEEGECLENIVKSLYGLKDHKQIEKVMDWIVKANGLKDKNSIKPGNLSVPTKGQLQEIISK